MKPDPRFQDKPMSFWACVRSLSQEIGYSKKGEVLTPDVSSMAAAFQRLDLDSSKLLKKGHPTALALELQSYFASRSDLLRSCVEPNLLTASSAKKLFDRMRKEYPTQSGCPLPLNKQKGEKKAHAFLTGMVNMVIQANTTGFTCDFDPRRLTTITKAGMPVRTLARRVDGAFPSAVNPIAIWEIKEYYYTTTFGSRIADGVYESLLDGMELLELRKEEDIDVKHYLIVDAHHTWWNMGKPYLCRIVDMLHMGYCDEVLFGREVATELPRICKEWVAVARALDKSDIPTAELKA